MAQKTIVELTDDLDHHLLNGDGQTVRFGLQDAEYEIDLGAEHAQQLHDALAPFIAAARRVNNRTTAKTAKTATEPADRADRAQLRAIRQWGSEHGMPVSPRGRIPKKLQDAYHAAH